MMKVASLLTPLVTALAVTLPSAAPVQAQTFRTFVSTAGSDNNPCSITEPCRHFQAAVNVTPAGGEVDALDPGGYSPITISQAIPIEGQGWSYIAPPTGGNGITITASSGNVAIHCVSLNGVGVTGATDGISFTGSGTLNVQNSVIRNFTNYGISFQPSAASQVFVSDTLLADNAYYGLYMDSNYTVSGSLDHVRAENNPFGGFVMYDLANGNLSISNSVSTGASNLYYCGIQIEGGSSTAIFTVNVSDSTIVNNDSGVCVGAYGTMVVRNSTVAGSTHNGIQPSSYGTVWVTRSTINGNGTAISSLDGGNVYSYGDNNLFGNGSGGNGSFTSTLQYK
jgi:hypothetical protein